MREDTFAAFGDLDASPTKAWILAHKDEPGMEPYVDSAFGRRPAEELYDVREDPFHRKNVAESPEYASVKGRLSKRLLTTLQETGDPRVVGGGTKFDQPPFAGKE